jgi:predicted nucleic acid-binding protein
LTLAVVSGSEFVVPPLFYSELLAWPVTVHSEDDAALQRRAFDIAGRFNSPRAYDARYLATADLLGCELWTADRRLYNAVRKDLSWVRYVGAAA